MRRSQKRLLLALAILPLLLLLAALVYQIGMTSLEGDPRGFWDSLAWAAETLSTTGYGEDGRWAHPVMVVFVIVLQFVGVFLVFLVFPIYLIPVLEERFEARLPTEVKPMHNHVVIFRSGPAVELLVEQLTHAGIETLFLEEDEAVARRLVDQGHKVLVGSIDDGVLERAHLEKARCLIANSSDDEDAAATLTARQLGFEGDLLALVEEPFHRQPMMLAGATATFTPRHVLGAVLAARASRRVSPAVAGVQSLGKRLRVGEVHIRRSSELVGQTLEASHLGQTTGATVIGQWVGGRLEAPVGPDAVIQPGANLIVVGSDAAIARLGELGRGTFMLSRQGRFVIAGCGEVGAKVLQLLRDVDEDTTVIDRDPTNAPDVVGDVLDPRVLESADVDSAQAVILALDTDAATLFATVILKGVAPDVPIFARVNRAENVERIHAAGAEFARSLSQVSGQMLVRRLLGEASIALDPQLKVLQMEATLMAGSHPARIGIRERSGCSIVAIERGSDLLTEFDDDLEIQASDKVYICGSSEATELCRELFAPE